MTFEEFLEKARERDGWALDEWGDRIRNRNGECPLQAVFGKESGYTTRGRKVGLRSFAITDAADGIDNEYRKALLGLVQS